MKTDMKVDVIGPITGSERSGQDEDFPDITGILNWLVWLIWLIWVEPRAGFLTLHRADANRAVQASTDCAVLLLRA